MQYALTLIYFDFFNIKICFYSNISSIFVAEYLKQMIYFIYIN